MSRPLVAGLFVSSVLLSVVSWYTTQHGMDLYLSPWFSFRASFGRAVRNAGSRCGPRPRSRPAASCAYLRRILSR